LHQQQGGVVAQVAGLVVDDCADQAADEFFGGLAAGGFPLGKVGQPLQAEQLPVRRAGLDHPVGVQQHRVAGLQVHAGGLGSGGAEPERQRRVTAQLGDHFPAAQQQRRRMPGARPFQPPRGGSEPGDDAGDER